MPAYPVGLSRSWVWPVAGLAVCCAGCAAPRASEAHLVARAEQAVADLERLQPRLAKAGTADAEGLAASLGAVRQGLTTLPAPDQQPTTPVEPVPPALVRCPEAGCWRLGTQLEFGFWRLALSGGGEELDDSGPVALGLAVGLERASPIDSRLEWSWGGEAVGTIQDRSGGQQVILVGVRPFIRAALAISEDLALTIRPLVEVGQASVQLGSPPGGVLDTAGVYAALGLRAGCRLHLDTGDLTAELGWRQIWFNASAGLLDYKVEISSPEIAVGWNWSF
jgi:hypothetical protein